MTDPVPADEDDKRARRTASPLRMCALSREEKPVDALLRFVAGPDGAIAADVGGKLGGRGVWVTSTRAALELAIKRNVFAKSLKMHIIVPTELIETIEHQLRERVRQSLSFANKAGLVVTGFTKVEKAVEAGKVALLIEAADAAEGGAEKLRRKFIAIATAANRPAMLTSSLRIADLSLAIGRSNVVHAALSEGGQCRAFRRECLRFERFQTSDDGSGVSPDSSELHA